MLRELQQRIQLSALVLRERFGWVQQERRSLAVMLEHRKQGAVITQGLPRSGRRHNHQVFALVQVPPSLFLVAVRPFDAARAQRALYVRREQVTVISILRRTRRNRVNLSHRRALTPSTRPLR